MPVSERQQCQDTTPKGQKRRITPSLQPFHSSKRHKRYHKYFPPPKFWDGLSKIHLTRNALLELDRRNQLIEHTCSQISHAPNRTLSLKHFAKQGGPELASIRGFRAPNSLSSEMSSTQSSLGRRKRGSHSPIKRIIESESKSNATSNFTSSKSASPYDRTFQQNLIDHNIFPNDYDYPDGALTLEPANMDAILQAMAQPRRSLSPSNFSDEDFVKFRRLDSHAFNEADILKLIPTIQGTIPYSGCTTGEVLFKNLDPLTDGSIVSAKPDIYHGARPEQLNAQVRKEQSHKIVPSSQADLPILPNFFLEAKGPDGTMSVATRQSCYNGALGARGMQSLRLYGELKPEYDNNAYTISSFYYGGTLKMFTSHPIPPRTPDGKPGFATTQIRTWGLTSDANTFRRGVSAFRNARDWAKRQRDAVIQRANEKAAERQSMPANGLGLTAGNKSIC